MGGELSSPNLTTVHSSGKCGQRLAAQLAADQERSLGEHLEQVCFAAPRSPTPTPRPSLQDVTTPESRAATAAAIGALTDFLTETEAGSPRPVGAYLQQLVDEDGVGALAQGYYGLLNLSALLLPMAAAQEDLTPRELLMQIALIVARDH